MFEAMFNSVALQGGHMFFYKHFKTLLKTYMFD